MVVQGLVGMMTLLAVWCIVGDLTKNCIVFFFATKSYGNNVEVHGQQDNNLSISLLVYHSQDSNKYFNNRRN